MAETHHPLKDLLAFVEIMRAQEEPIEDRFVLPPKELLSGLTEKERQTMVLCGVFLSAMYDRHHNHPVVSVGEVLGDARGSREQFLAALDQIRETERTDHRFVPGDLIADPVRASVFPDLTDAEIERFCDWYGTSLGIFEHAFARERIFIYEADIGAFVPTLAV